MELRQLRYFKAIADARSFARGAYHLRIAQPALSRAIASLEREIGQNVFIRHSAGVSLTDAGARLYEHVDGVLRRIQLLSDEMSTDLGTPHGLVTLGAPPSMQTVLTAPVTAEFLATYPAVKLNVMQSTSSNLRDAVIAGHVDLAVISTLTPSRGLRYLPLFSEGVCLVERGDAPPRDKTMLKVSDLIGEELLLCGYPNTMKFFIEERFAELGIKKNFRCEVNSAALLIDLVRSGSGAGIVPSGAVACDDTRDLRVTQIDGLGFTWALATSHERLGSGSVTHLIAMIVRHVTDLIDAGKWPSARLDADAGMTA